MAWTAIGIAAAVGAGLGGIAASVNSLVNGIYPWESPLDYLTAELKGIGIGGAGGAITGAAGAALGPALGSSASAVGVGSNVGTQAVEAGAMTPTALGGTVSQAGGAVLKQAGEQATQGVLEKAVSNTIGGAATGALNNPDDPLKGVAMGAAGGLASAGLQSGVNATFRGMDSGFFSPSPGRVIEPVEQTMSSLHPSQMTEFSTYRPTASIGGRALGMAGRAAPGLGSRAASMSVGSAMTPRPTAPPPNPYEMSGYRPYWLDR